MRSLILSTYAVAVPANSMRRMSSTSSETPLTNSPKMRTLTLAGYPFSPPNDVFLRALRRAKGYDTDVWVPLPTAQALRLALRPRTNPPVRIPHANGDCLYYHSSQFRSSLGEMRRRWRRFAESTQALEGSGGEGRPADAIALPEAEPPLNTNGERFERATELQMIERARRHGYPSRYWATPQEAAYLFQSPFADPFLNIEEHGVEVANPFTSKSIIYYNVSGTKDPSKFTPEFCQRYDPYNFYMKFYRPITAIQLKRFAIEHNCMDQQQWITPKRAKWLHVSLSRGATPIVIIYDSSLIVHLVNLKMTENPKLLQDCSFMKHTRAVEEDEALVFQDVINK